MARVAHKGAGTRCWPGPVIREGIVRHTRTGYRWTCSDCSNQHNTDVSMWLCVASMGACQDCSTCPVATASLDGMHWWLYCKSLLSTAIDSRQFLSWQTPHHMTVAGHSPNLRLLQNRPLLPLQVPEATVLHAPDAEHVTEALPPNVHCAKQVCPIIVPAQVVGQVPCTKGAEGTAEQLLGAPATMNPEVLVSNATDIAIVDITTACLTYMESCPMIVVGNQDMVTY